jgi:hypothetical protein
MVRWQPLEKCKDIKANKMVATAQGIVAQVRVFGGSLGIAASSAILGVTLKQQVGRSVTPQQLSSLGGGNANVTPGQLAVVRKAYSDAFREDMRVCTIIAAIALLWALGTYNHKCPTSTEQQVSEKVKKIFTAIAAVGKSRQQDNVQ